jgi:hypothetical protein
MVCTLSDEMKAKLKAIYDEGDELFPGFSDGDVNKKRHDWQRTQYEPLGVSQREWLAYVCDTLGIVDICVD